MRKGMFIVILLVFCTGLQAQDIDTSVTEETKAELTLEEKLREKKLPHSLWDNQKPGEWNDAAEGRLSRQEVPANKLKELREMKALQYEQASRKGNNWAQGLGTWANKHKDSLQTLLYILLGLLLLACLLLFIRKNDIRLFRRSHEEKGNEDILTTAGPQNYDALARTAIAAGNWREAVRMRYLHSLQLLEAKQLIAPGKDKTNMDYLRELASTAWYKPFAKLTLHYEYVWYGQQPLNNGQFAQLEEQFSAFKTSLR